MGPHGRTRKLGGLLMLLPPVKVGTRVVFLHFQCDSLNKNSSHGLLNLNVWSLRSGTSRRCGILVGMALWERCVTGVQL